MKKPRPLSSPQTLPKARTGSRGLDEIAGGVVRRLTVECGADNENYLHFAMPTPAPPTPRRNKS